MTVDTRQLCTFTVGGELFGLEIEEIREIIRDQPATPVPLAPPAVAGLINLRGQIVPVIELRGCLGLGAADELANAAILIVSAASGFVGLRVDEIGDVLAFSAAEREEPPTNVKGPLRTLLRHVYKRERGLLLALSAERAIDLALSTALPAHAPGSASPIHV